MSLILHLHWSFKKLKESVSSSRFSNKWWFWLTATGLSLGCVVSIKWVGFFAIALVGLVSVSPTPNIRIFYRPLILEICSYKVHAWRFVGYAWWSENAIGKLTFSSCHNPHSRRYHNFIESLHETLGCSNRLLDFGSCLRLFFLLLSSLYDFEINYMCPQNANSKPLNTYQYRYDENPPVPYI